MPFGNRFWNQRDVDNFLSMKEGAINTGQRVEKIEGPFADIFPAGNISHHFIGQGQARGVYAKELRIPAGYWMISHAHSYDHLSILASGTITLEYNDQWEKLVGPCAVTIKAGENHKLRAYTDAVWFCIHPTDETDADKVDEAILKAD